MFETRGSTAFVTMGDLKTRAQQAIGKAQEKAVYLLRDGEPVAGIVSIEMLELLRDVLEDRYISDVAHQRFQLLREGSDELLDANGFWAQADALMASRREQTSARSTLDPGLRRGDEDAEYTRKRYEL